MPSIAGHGEVDRDDRDEAVAVMRGPVTRARDAPGCLDVAITGDPVDPGRVYVFERREWQASVGPFRGGPRPGDEQSAAMLPVSVQEYDIVDVRPVLGKEAG